MEVTVQTIADESTRELWGRQQTSKGNAIKGSSKWEATPQHQLRGPHDGMTFRISTERWVSFLKKGEIYCMIEAQGCGLERPRPGRWVPEQGTWDVLCGKCPVGRPTGAERPRKKDAGTTAEAGTTKAGVPYDGLRQQ